MAQPSSIDAIIDVTRFDGVSADVARAPDLVFEVPHGATRTEDFTRLEAVLASTLPASLVDFFHVNTDAGAPELAYETARRFVALAPSRSALVLRCRIPRTFIDCNRVIDAAPEDFKAGKVTPGLMPWVTHPDDRALLRQRYEHYVAAVRDAVEPACGAGGALVMLHTYAPRSVDVEVDADIVKNLRRAYEPNVESTWPLRPEVDVIGRALDGTSYAPGAVVDRLRTCLAPTGITLADSATYPMHPSTLAWRHALAWPGRTLCLEVRRDLVADPFEPFAEMRIGAQKVAPIAAALAEAALAWWAR
jgi:predicted N-formylglutamate amidohydrolase